MISPDDTTDSATATTVDIRPCKICRRRNPIDARFCGGCGQPVLDSPVERVGVESVADPLVGRIIADRYRIVKLLGRGGMGVVYQVEHVHIGKLMAMKLLHGELARERNTIRRFQREAEAVSRLSHPNTVQVFDFGRSEGLMYLVMEFLEGRDLGQLIRDEGPLDFDRVARIGAQVCASLGEAHSLGIVHRDIKPENVMVLSTPDGREMAKVLDFGLAKLRDHTGNLSVTRAGAIVGTPYYMSPEQIRGEEVDARGDVYAAGALLYKAATGVPPFVANTPMGVLTKHLTEELVLPSERSGRPLPLEADTIIGRAMAKEAADRYRNATELGEDLLRYMESVGQAMSDPRLARPSSEAPPAAAARPVATRADVDGYERRLRRRGYFGYAVIALLVASVGVASYKAWERYDDQEIIPVVEAEPNNRPATAHPLPPDFRVRGTLGRRQSTSVGDVDIYRIENTSREHRILEARVSGIPNIDVVLDVVREGQSDPVLSADAHGIGGDEHVANFPLTGATYFLRVRERWIAGRLPMENVSDEYSIEWSLREVEAGEEREVNDSLELATELNEAGSIRGWIGWGDDVDIYCIPDGTTAARVEVSAVADLDLRLRTVDRVLHRSRLFDEAGIGAAEQATLEPGVGRCVEVSVSSEPRPEATVSGDRANADQAYQLTVHVEPDAEATP